MGGGRAGYTTEPDGRLAVAVRAKPTLDSRLETEPPPMVSMPIVRTIL
jgi:hypothetical protein